MSGFIFFAIIFFVLIPMFKKNAKRIAAEQSAENFKNTPRSGARQQNWSQVQELLQQKISEQSGQSKNTGQYQYDKQRAQRNRKAQGHSSARRETRQRMHAGDNDRKVFPKSHMARVRKRDQRDRSERNRIEAMLHSKNNTSIVREGNRGMDSWGVRGDKKGGSAFLFLILFGLIAVLVISKVAPDVWQELMRALSIK